jgi:hypothetical protein
MGTFEDDGFDPVTEALGRPPIRIDDQTTPETIEAEMRERLEALLASHNGTEPTPEGWRDLALALALRYEPAFQIETPVDRTGRSGIGGRPAEWTNFLVRSAIKAELRKGAKSERAAAKIVAPRFGITQKTAQNIMSVSSPPDTLRRSKYEWVAENAALAAAKGMSR